MITTKYSIIKPTTHDFFNPLSAEMFCEANGLNIADITTEEIEINLASSLAGRIVLSSELPDITGTQMRQALIYRGFDLEMVTAALNTLPSPQKELALVEWEYGTILKRNTSLTSGVGQLLGWTEIQIDDLWTYAGTL